MNKTVVVLIGIAIVVVGGIYLVRSSDSGSGTPNPGGASSAIPDHLNDYFEERLTASGVADIGQPIEGFDSGLLIIAFPGLLEADFNGVETFEGHYDWRDNSLQFVRDVQQPISSAERTVADDGYETLLANVAMRLKLDVNTESDVDALIVLINTGERVKTVINQGGSAFGVTVIPQEVLEDSRCPIDVQCIQAGTVRLRTLLKSASGEATQIFILNQPITTEAETVTLVAVDPSPLAGVRIRPVDYTFFFEIKKRTPLQEP